MLLFSAVHSYGHQLLRESLPFQDDIDIPSLVGMNWQLKEINGAVVLLKDPPGLIFSSDSSLGGSNGISCPRMTNEQKQQRRDFMGVLRQDKDAIAYSISEDEQELTLHVDDTPTMTLMRIPFAGSAAS